MRSFTDNYVHMVNTNICYVMARVHLDIGLAAFLLLLVNCHGAQISDWLVTNITTPTSLEKIYPGNLRLSNGLIFREFSVYPDFATVNYYSYEKQSSVLRALSPEAVISLDGIIYNIGGLVSSMPRAYFNRTAFSEDHTQDMNAFHYVSHKVHIPEAPFPYTPRRGAPENIVWPPKGLRLDVLFRAPVSAPLYHKMVDVVIHYEMYDGVPMMAKWLTVSAQKEAVGKVKLGIFSIEYLAVNWQWAASGYGWLHTQTDRAHSSKVDWHIDTKAGNMPGSFQQNVNFTYSPLIPYLTIQTDVMSFKAIEMLVGSKDVERLGLAKRRLMRMLAPHTQENPIFFHMIHSDSKSVRAIVDQMVDVGFELLIYSFGSGFDIESQNETYIEALAKDVSYATSRGLEVGGYDLIALTRTVKPEWRATSKGRDYNNACFASGWYDFLLDRVLSMMNRTGISFIETDGPYGGYTCASTNHSHHQGYEDSVYQQDRLQGEFYKILREKNVYINQPDTYFYQGGNKDGMGYNENQYSLPRWQDISISRQGMFDDTFHFIPTVGWMFLPITVYHGGGAAAMFKPLSEHYMEYNWALAQYFGSGVAACYRGDQLFDGPQTKQLVQKWVSFYKKYRDILSSDIIHVRRADMQSIDCLIHVNPFLQNKALAMVFNPTNTYQSMELTIPLYYSGLTRDAFVSQEEAPLVQYSLDRQYNIDIVVKLPPLGVTWYIIQGQ